MNSITVTLAGPDAEGRCRAWLIPPRGAEYNRLRTTGSTSLERVLVRAYLDVLSIGYDPRSGTFDLDGRAPDDVAEQLSRLGVPVQIRCR